MLNWALSEARQNHMDVRQARTLFALGDLAQNRGDHASARRCFEESSRLAEGEHLRRLAATANARLAALSMDRDRSLTDAERLSRQSIQSTFDGRDAFHLPRTLATSAEVEMRGGHLSEAERKYSLASDLVDRLLTNVTPFEQKDFLLASIEPIYLGQARLALKIIIPGRRSLLWSTATPEELPNRFARIRSGIVSSRPDERGGKACERPAGLLFHEADRTRRSNILAEIWETEKRGIIIRDSDPIPFGADSQPVSLSRSYRAPCDPMNWSWSTHSMNRLRFCLPSINVRSRHTDCHQNWNWISWSRTIWPISIRRSSNLKPRRRLTDVLLAPC